MMTRCTWYEPAEEPGSRLLIPGCMGRVQDPDKGCTCPTTTEEIERLEAECGRLRKSLAVNSEDLSDLIGAVGDHRDCKAIFAAADARTAARAAYPKVRPS